LPGFLEKLGIRSSSAASDNDTAPPKQVNQRVAEQIAGALRNAGLSKYDIRIRFQRGTATLTGSIADLGQQALVGKIARSVDGVDAVDNQLTVDPIAMPAPVDRPPRLGDRTRTASSRNEPPVAAGSRQGNQAMAERIAESLSAAKLTTYDIVIRYIEGTAILSGTVRSPGERTVAGQIASRVDGVRQVQNDLAIASVVAPAFYQQPAAGQPAAGQPPAGVPLPPGPAPAIPAPPAYGHPGRGASNTVYNMPHLPEHAWPTYAAYPNYSQVSYPKEYSASAWPYIGPFYPYPQIPLGWRQAQLEWDDGHWSLNFRPRTDKWWWFLNPENW